MFGGIYGASAKVEKLFLENVNITSGDYSGGLCGVCGTDTDNKEDGCSLEKIKVSGVLKSYSSSYGTRSGGLVGSCEGHKITIDECISDVEVATGDKSREAGRNTRVWSV